MCGIFGSSDKERFLTLYNLNKKRGTFSTSASIVTEKGDLVVMKWEGSPSVKVVDNQLKILENRNDQASKYFLGHTQAPTSSNRKYSTDTAHPFNTEYYTVAHNGVLTNFNELKQNFNKKWKNPVDSSIIPFVFFKLDEEAKNINDFEITIAKGLSLIEGTFGLWVFNSGNKNIYISRVGSTIFANKINNDFSSVVFDGSEQLEEGVVYQITREGLTSVHGFDFNSPFFT